MKKNHGGGRQRAGRKPEQMEQSNCQTAKNAGVSKI